MSVHRLAGLGLAFLLLAGCAAGGGTRATLPFTPAAALPAAANSQVVSIKFTVPDGKRPPGRDKNWGYISPGSKSVKIIAAGYTGANVTPGSPGCHRAQAGTVCTIGGILTYPKLSIVVAFYDSPLTAEGYPQGKLLTYGSAAPPLAKTTKFVSIYQNGIVQKIGAALKDPSPPSGKQIDTPVSLAIYDAAGFPIPQPAVFYADKYPSGSGDPQPWGIQFGISTPTAFKDGEFSFVVNGKVNKNGVFLKQSADVLLRYSGRGVRTAQLNVTGPENTVSVDITPKPGFGKTVALSPLGPNAKMCLQPYADMWYIEPDAKKFASIDPEHPGTPHEFPIASGRTPIGIACGGSDVLYLALSGDTIAYVYKSRVKEYTIPTANAGLHSISMQGTPGWNGSFTEETAGKVGVYTNDRALGEWFEFPVPAGGHPTELLGEWFSDPGTNAVGTVNSTPAAVEYTLPKPNSQPGELTVGGLPNMVSTAIWFVELSAPRVGTIDITTRSIKEFATNAPLRHITRGWDGWVYATDSKNQVEAIDPKGHVTIVGHCPQEIIGIVSGANANLWLLTWNSKASSLVEVIP